VAVGDDEAAWTAAASRLTESELKDRVTGAGGVSPEEWDVETLLLRMDEKQQDRMDAAMAIGRWVLGPDRPDWQIVEAMAMEWLGAHGEWVKDAPSSSPARKPVVLDEAARAAWLEVWRSRAEEVVRQLESLDLADGLVDGVDRDARDPVALDASLRRLVEARSHADVAFGRQAEIVKRMGAWRLLGFTSFDRYCRERLGLSERTVNERIKLENRMVALPELRQALESGLLTYSKVLVVARLATALDVKERIANPHISHMRAPPPAR